MKEKEIICGFSKLSKEEKINYIAGHCINPEQFRKELQSYNHTDAEKQKLFDEFSENTISNYFMPFGIAPNFLIDGKVYHVPMVIEESSVVAAASKSAKFWSDRGGFHTEIVSMEKIGQVHFFWKGNKTKLNTLFPDLVEKFHESTQHITANMRKRGGGILNIELVDKNDEIPDYYQIKATFNTVDSMGANFINSVLEEFASVLKEFFLSSPYFTGPEKLVEVVMSILSNYTPDCVVKTWVECDINRLDGIDDNLSGEEFASRFQRAVNIAKVDPYRATTHNKGIFNGIDAVVLATGNDFRAVEASGHAYASRNGRYTSLTDVEIKDGKFRYTLTLPLSLGTVGGLTSLHPLVVQALRLLGNPNAEELMRIVASVGLANNFGAIKSLVTKGIQKGHMKMHLMNILNQFKATEQEKKLATRYFREFKVTVKAVQDFLEMLRDPSFIAEKLFPDNHEVFFKR